MFNSSFSLTSPAVIPRCGFSDPWAKFMITFDEVMENVREIGGLDRLRVHAVRNDSSHLYNMEMGFPLQIMVRITNYDGMRTSAHCEAEFYLDEKTGQAAAWSGEEEHRGDTDTVIKALADAILKQLQAQVI